MELFAASISFRGMPRQRSSHSVYEASRMRPDLSSTRAPSMASILRSEPTPA